MRRPGSAFQPVFALSPNRCSVLGEREGVRGPTVGIYRAHASYQQTHDELRSRRLGASQLRPPSPNLSPRIVEKNWRFGWRGEKSAELPTQVGALGLLPRAGLDYVALSGRIRGSGRPPPMHFLQIMFNYKY